MKHPVRFAFRLLLALALLLWLLPLEAVFWPPLELNQVFAKRIAPARNAFYRLEDPLRRFFGGYAVPDTLPVLQFTLPEVARAALYAQLDSIRVRGINGSAGRQWQAGTLQTTTADAPPQAAEITWHGKFQNHWLGRQRSFKVKLAKGQNWWGMREFTLLTPDNRDLAAPLVVAVLAARLGLWHPRTRLVRVELNGADLGLYWAEEPLNRAFLQARGLPDGVMLAPRAAWADDFPDHRRAPAYGQHVGLGRGAHAHALALEPAFQEVDVTPSDSATARALGAWQTVRDLVTRTNDAVETAAGEAPPLPDSATVAAVFDLAAWGRADALRHLLADEHNLAFDNLHVVFDPRTGRFQPIYRFEGGIVPANRTNGLTNAATLAYNGQPLPLWLFVNRHPTLRLTKLRALHQLTASAEAIQSVLRAAEPAAQLVTRAPGSEFPIRQRRWKWDKLQRALRQNRALIHQSLTADAWLYATVRRAGNALRIELLPESEGALRVRIAGQTRTVMTRSGPLPARPAPVGAAEGLRRTVETFSIPWPAERPFPAPLLDVSNALSGNHLPAEQVRAAEVR